MNKHVKYLSVFMVLVGVTILQATTYYVAPWGDDTNPGTSSQPWRTIQKSANTLQPGDTVLVMDGVYYEKVTINVSGTPGNPIVFSAYPGQQPIIDGTGVAGQHMIYMSNKDYIVINGFEIRNNQGGSGIFVENGGDYIQVLNNKIHNMAGPHGMGITVYAHGADSVTHILISGNQIYNCEPATSEALVVNGNVFDFQILNNIVHDVNNIGIDAIGEEVAGKVARRGLIKGNIVYNAHSSYGGGYAAGIYIDGAQQVVVEQNIVYQSDLGIEVGCENAGYVAKQCTVRVNLIYNNDKSGLLFGGYDASVGRVKYCMFNNNVVFKNQVVGDGDGEVLIQYASYNTFVNNIIFAGPQGIMLTSWGGNHNNTLDYNCWKPSSEPHADLFVWNNSSYNTFTAYQSATGQDQHSIKTDPMFVDTLAFDFHLRGNSPCIDAGNPTTPPGYDFDGNSTPVDGDNNGVPVVDIGAYEFIPPTFVEHTDQFSQVPHIYFSNGTLGFSGLNLLNSVSRLFIIDSNGRVVKNFTITPSKSIDLITLDLGNIPSGVYHFVLTDGHMNFKGRFILIQ